MGLDSLYCGKWRKISKSHRDLDLDQTKPNVELVRAISYTTICSSFKSIEPLFFELSCTQTHTRMDGRTDGRTDRQTHTHTDGHEYSIVAVDKPQL